MCGCNSLCGYVQTNKKMERIGKTLDAFRLGQRAGKQPRHWPLSEQAAIFLSPFANRTP